MVTPESNLPVTTCGTCGASVYIKTRDSTTAGNVHMCLHKISVNSDTVDKKYRINLKLRDNDFLQRKIKR